MGPEFVVVAAATAEQAWRRWIGVRRGAGRRGEAERSVVVVEVGVEFQLKRGVTNVGNEGVYSSVEVTRLSLLSSFIYILTDRLS